MSISLKRKKGIYVHVKKKLPGIISSSVHKNGIVESAEVIHRSHCGEKEVKKNVKTAKSLCGKRSKEKRQNIDVTVGKKK